MSEFNELPPNDDNVKRKTASKSEILPETDKICTAPPTKPVLEDGSAESVVVATIPIDHEPISSDMTDPSGNHWCCYTIAKASDDPEFHETIFDHLIQTLGITAPDSPSPMYKKAYDLKDLSSLLNTSSELTIPGKSYLYYKHHLALVFEKKNINEKTGYINGGKLVSYIHPECMEKYKRYQTLLVAKKKIPLKIINDAKSIVPCKCIHQVELSSFVGLFKGVLKMFNRNRKNSKPTDPSATFSAYNLIIDAGVADISITDTLSEDIGGLYRLHPHIQLPMLDGENIPHLVQGQTLAPIGNVIAKVHKEQRGLKGTVNKEGISGIMQLGKFSAKTDGLAHNIYLSCKRLFFLYEF